MVLMDEYEKCEMCNKDVDNTRFFVNGFDGDYWTFCSKKCAKKFILSNPEHLIEEFQQ